MMIKKVRRRKAKKVKIKLTKHNHGATLIKK